MTEENKKRCREEIELRNWNKLGIIEPNVSPLVWNKEVELMYEDMDGQPCRCNAIYVHNSFGSDYFQATNGMAKGNRMSSCIAYRELK
ncbi:MAG: hypothetical protein K0S18_95 [Anaerocolumna sp.]|jgi:hypothetical protein|nr:hypothetical protein [Anaerocolumna sp.]